LQPGGGVAGAATPAAGLAGRRAGPWHRHERCGACQRAAAVLLDQAQRHRAGAGTRAGNRRGARRAHCGAEPRRRRAVRVAGAGRLTARRCDSRRMAPYFFVGRCQPSTTLCRERATVSLPAGAGLVTTEPAAMVASWPMVTGATSELLEPMKAPSSIVVRDLFTPS